MSSWLLSDTPSYVWPLNGGLKVVFEQSDTPNFAFSLRIPVGSAHDPKGQEGAANLLAGWLGEGAGERDAQSLRNAFDDLGLQRGSSTGYQSTTLWARGLTEDLEAALGLTADILMRSLLPEDQVAIHANLARQDLEGIEDSPSTLLYVEAQAMAYPSQSAFSGFTHPIAGTLEGLSNLNPKNLREQLKRYGQTGSILGIVANIKPQQALALAQLYFGDLPAGEEPATQVDYVGNLRHHIDDEDASQTHIHLLAKGIDLEDKQWLNWKVALSVLSGGSSSRLFSKVREDKGLAYSVSADAFAFAKRGFLSAYAGTTPARATETLKVLLEELKTLPRGISASEFERVHKSFKAGQVYGQETVSSRLSNLISELWFYGRVRPFSERKAEIAALNLHDVNSFLSNYNPLAEASIFTLGSEPIESEPIAADLGTDLSLNLDVKVTTQQANLVTKVAHN